MTRRRDPLSPEDRHLWEHLARAVEPLRSAKPRVHAVGPEAQNVPRASLRHETRVIGTAAEQHHVRPHLPYHPPSVPKRTPPLAEFDRRKAKAIRSGRVEIDARLDLHGLRQQEAHQALRTFLARCFSQGHRTALVITGKGAPVRRPFDDTPFGEVNERGVLRRNVPMWLAEPELRALVVSYTEAAVQHGGDGALYIHLRSRRPA